MLLPSNVILVNFYTYEYVKENPDILFVFGDNLLEKGKAGQAIIRDLPNTLGIPTKRKPCLKYEDCYFSDTDEEFELLSERLNNLERYVNMGYKIALPKTGLGTGLANMKNKSPKLFRYLTNRLRKLHPEYLRNIS